MEIAEELAKQQKAISVAEFFEKNRQILGFDSAPRALITCVKEAVDNSLDACEDAGILPDIFVQIKKSGDYYRVIVEDNGPGIVPEEVPRVFAKLLYGSRFHTLRQSRGQQGIGISAAVLYSQLTSGRPSTAAQRRWAGISARQGGHQVAQKFTITTFPFSLARSTTLPSAAFSENVGAFFADWAEVTVYPKSRRTTTNARTRCMRDPF